MVMRYHFGLGVGHMHGGLDTASWPFDEASSARPQGHDEELDLECLVEECTPQSQHEGSCSSNGSDSGDGDSDSNKDYTDDEEFLVMEYMYGHS